MMNRLQILVIPPHPVEKQKVTRCHGNLRCIVPENNSNQQAGLQIGMHIHVIKNNFVIIMMIYVVGTQKSRLIKTVLLSTQTILFNY